MIKRTLLFFLLLPFYTAGYLTGCLVWVAVIVWAAIVEAYLIGRGNA